MRGEVRIVEALRENAGLIDMNTAMDTLGWSLPTTHAAKKLRGYGVPAVVIESIGNRTVRMWDREDILKVAKREAKARALAPVKPPPIPGLDAESREAELISKAEELLEQVRLLRQDKETEGNDEL